LKVIRSSFQIVQALTYRVTVWHSWEILPKKIRKSLGVFNVWAGFLHDMKAVRDGSRFLQGVASPGTI
jgi:hypothetical protein